jgi:N-acetylneuraminate synthase/sialic acid synthase
MLGARLFEKHFTLNRSWKGADQSFSLEPGGLRRVVRDLERARVALGDGEKQPYESEAAPLAKMVKRIVAARDLKAGAILTEMDLAFRIVAGNKTGPAALQPFHADKLIGRKLETDLIKDDLVTYAAVGICAGTN